MIERVSCPAELDAPIPQRPVAGPNAVIEANPAGAAYLSAEIGYGTEVGSLLSDAQAACARSKEPAPRP